MKFYSVNAAVFLKRRDQIVQLFPEVDPDVVYVPAYADKFSKNSISAHGSLYEHYKYMLRLLGNAKDIKHVDNDEISLDLSNST